MTIKRRNSLLCGAALLCTGCIVGRLDLAPQHRSAAYQNVGVVHAPRLVNIDVEFHHLGRNQLTVANRIRPDIVKGLTSKNVFVEADDSNRAHAGHLLVVVKHEFDGKFVREVLTNTAIESASLGLITTDAEIPYDMNVTYSPPTGTPTTWTSHVPILTSFGIMALRDNENTLAPREVLPTLTEGMAANFAQDFWAKNANEPGMIASGPAPIETSPLPASDVIQTAAETSPASTSYR